MDINRLLTMINRYENDPMGATLSEIASWRKKEQLQPKDSQQHISVNINSSDDSWNVLLKVGWDR
jgi:hypothetical protein